MGKEIRSEKIKNDINNILGRFFFEFNTEKARKQICYELSNYLNMDVVDKTTKEMIRYDQFDFRVKLGNNYYPLNDIIVHVERIEKLKKIIKWKE